MFKNLTIVILYFFLILTFWASATPLFNSKCTVSISSSSGSFYETTNYSFKDALKGNGKCKTYERNYDFNKNVIEFYNAKIVEVSKIDGYATNYYCYSPSLPNAMVINGNKVNVHVAVVEDRVVVGYPIIYFGY